MGSKSRPGSRRTFIEEARRRQIVDAAISTVAEGGLSQATLARIADEVGISKSVISYHFGGRDELIEELISTLLAEQGRFVKARVDRAAGAAERLRAYIEGSFAFMAGHREQVSALVDVWGSFGTVEAKRAFNATAYDPCRRHLESILRQGQAEGVFRDLVPATVAATVQGAIDGVMLQWVFDESSVDLPGCAAELVRMFELATGRV